jgi:hypothetical protein
MARQLFLGICLVGALGTWTAANADPITFRFSGTVVAFDTDTPIPGLGPLVLGDRVVGRVTFEGGTPDLVPDPRDGLYRPLDGRITVDSPQGHIQTSQDQTL